MARKSFSSKTDYFFKKGFFVFKMVSCERYATFERQDLHVFYPFLRLYYLGVKLSLPFEKMLDVAKCHETYNIQANTCSCI